jgi:aminopeptidase-like protein
MAQLIRDLYPICRSITGDGVRDSLRRIAREIPLHLREVPSGTRVLDWNIPREWNIRDAWIKNTRGERIVDFAVHNLHIMSYSVPFRGRVTLQELRRHLHSLPDHPDWIPYRTSYYADDWAFCVTQRQYDSMTDAEYDVCIDADLNPGAMTYAECLLPGRTDTEVLVSAHICHPSLANDNLSGIAVATQLARYVAMKRRRYSYRFLFAPGTIGAIAWLAEHETALAAIAHGLVLAGVGDPGPVTYKSSRRGNTEIDRAMAHVLRQRSAANRIEAFSPYGHDERQFCSPGFDLAVGCLMRSPWGTYPEYHTSADAPDFVASESLMDSLETCIDAIDVLEGNATYVNRRPRGEPQLGRYGLYGRTGGSKDVDMAMLWVLNLSDGNHTLLDIAERAQVSFAFIRRAADALLEAELVATAPERTTTGGAAYAAAAGR